MTDPNRRDFIAQSAGALAAFALAPELLPAMPVRHAGQAHAVAVVGLGRQGRAIIAELNKIDAVDIAAVCDVVPARVDNGIERAPGAAGVADHRALLAGRPDVESIIVATPTHLHRDVVIDCLSAGRNVYCEAPLASTVEDCDAIVAAAGGAASVFHVGLQARSNPIYRRVWSLMRAGSLRDVVSLYAQHHRKTSWRFPGSTPELEAAANWRLDPAVSIGLAGELGTHQFDVMRWMLGSEPVRVDGTGSIRLHDDDREIHDTVDVRLHWDDGVVLDYRASLATSFGGTHEVLHGSNASVRLGWDNGWLFKEADAPTEGWEVYATRQRFHNEEGIALVADATRLAAQGRLQDGRALEHPPLYYALADFVRSIMEGAPVACTAEDGQRATALGIAAHRAVMDGTSVTVD